MAIVQCASGKHGNMFFTWIWYVAQYSLQHSKILCVQFFACVFGHGMEYFILLSQFESQSTPSGKSNLCLLIQTTHNPQEHNSICLGLLHLETTPWHPPIHLGHHTLLHPLVSKKHSLDFYQLVHLSMKTYICNMCECSNRIIHISFIKACHLGSRILKTFVVDRLYKVANWHFRIITCLHLIIIMCDAQWLHPFSQNQMIKTMHESRIEIYTNK